jgi:hypothetical protein
MASGSRKKIFSHRRGQNGGKVGKMSMEAGAQQKNIYIGNYSLQVAEMAGKSAK